MLFGQVSSYTVPHQETGNLGFMEFTWQMGSFSLYQQMDNRSRSMSEFDVYFSTSSTVARYGLQDGSFGVLPVNSSEGPGPAGSLAVKSPGSKVWTQKG